MFLSWLTRGARHHSAPNPPTVDTSAPATPNDPVRASWSDAYGVLAIRAAQTIALLVVIALLFWAMSYLGVVFIPVILALIISSAVFPLLAWLRSRGMSSIVATWLVFVGAFVVVGSLITAIVTAVRSQWSDLATSAQDGFSELLVLLEDSPIDIDSAQIDSARQSAIDFLTSSQFGSGAVAGLSATGTFFTSFFLTLIVTFFFMKDGPAIWEFILRPLQGSGYERARRVGTRSVRTMGDYIRGTATVAAVDAIGIGLGLVILGVPLAIPLAVIVFLTAFIPLVGATLAGFLAALVALVDQGIGTALIVVVIVIAVNQLEGNFLQPKIMGKTLSLHPLVILLGLTAGTIIGGIVGAVLSVPIAAVAWGVLQVWDGPDQPAQFIAKKEREKKLDKELDVSR